MQSYRDLIPDFDRFLEIAERPLPHTIRANPHKIAQAELCDRLAEKGFSVRQNEYNQDIFTLDTNPSKTLDHWIGHFYMQELSASFAPRTLAPEEGERVLDLAAAPGGKTTYLSQLMRNTGTIMANDVNANRIRALQANVYRLGCVNVAVTQHDGRHLPSLDFDRVLLDAPCSGEGTLREKEGTPERDEEIESLAELQKQLIDRAIQLTRKGGTIVYSTCTFAPEENEAVIDHALNEHDVTIASIDLDIPHEGGVTQWRDETYDKRIKQCVRIYPHHINSGGSFIAKLCKN